MKADLANQTPVIFERVANGMCLILRCRDRFAPNMRKWASRMAKKGKLPTDVKALARVHTETALKVLAGIMTNLECPPAARVAAATTILARGWGQPHQSI